MSQYTQEQFVAAFEKVQDKKHWKNPVNAVIDATENLHLIREAIIHFTATVPTFDILKVTEAGTKILVRADGYYAGPAGDR